MNIIDKDGSILDHIYTSHDRFLEDLDDYISKNFCFSVSIDNTIDLLDCVCGHLLYWHYKTYSDDSQSKLIYDGLFKQNEILQRLIKIGDSTPELVIYEFNGTSLYYGFSEDDIEYVPDSESYFAMLEDNSKLYFTKEEFAEMGGEITLPVDEEDEVSIEFSWSSYVYFFMKNEDAIKMNDYLYKCILELNNIYLSLEMKVIDIQ
jgi:hypothetical protein